jgi:hypothetical protein
MRLWSGLDLLAGEDAGPGVLGDTACGTGQARADLAAAGHTAIIKPGPLRPAVPGGFTKVAPWTCIATMLCCGRPTGTGQPVRTCGTYATSTGPWSSAQSPGRSALRAAAASSATAVSPKATSVRDI